MSVPIAVTAVTIVGMLYAVDLAALAKTMEGVDYGLLGLAALKVPIQVFLWTLRWHLVILSRNFQVSFKHTFMAVIVRGFFNNLTPGAGTGGEPIGAYYLSLKSKLTFKQSMASTASERLCQGLVFVGIVIITGSVVVPFLPVSSSIIWSILAGAGIFCIFVIFMVYLSIYNFRYGRSVVTFIIRAIAWLIPPLRRRWDLTSLDDHVDEWHGEFKAFFVNRKAVFWVTVLSLINWGFDLAQPYLIFKALDVDVPIWLIVMNATILRIGGIFAIIPGGAGIMEGLNIALYAGLSSIPAEAIVAQTIIFRALDAWLLWFASGLLTSIGLSSLTAELTKSKVVQEAE